MKTAVIFLVILMPLKGFTQISITTSDMPSTGDTFRVSNGLIDPTLDPVATGASYTWDFSMLQWISQDVDSFISVSATGPIYSIVFANLPFNPYRANLAARGPDLPAIPQITISDVNYFYYNSTGSYEVSGYGALINGLPVPIPFNNKDRIYDFPVNFGNMDSSDSDFQISLPGIGYYEHDQHRVNAVDGWGTLITPFGTFNTIRVKSVITSNDSVYLDTLGTGIGFSLPPTIEYKWLGAGEGIPLLQINTSVTPLGPEIITSIRYRDSLRITSGLFDIFGSSPSVSVFPNPVTDQLVIDITSFSSEPVTITVFNTLGEKVAGLYNGLKTPGRNRFEFNPRQVLQASGIYYIETSMGGHYQHTPVIYTAP